MELKKCRSSPGVEVETKRKGRKGGKGPGRGSVSTCVGKTGRNGGKEPVGARTVDKFGIKHPGVAGFFDGDLRETGSS